MRNQYQKDFREMNKYIEINSTLLCNQCVKEEITGKLENVLR